MKIDKTLERIINKVVFDLKKEGVVVNKQIVVDCIQACIDVTALGIKYHYPVQIPYLGKVYPKIKVYVSKLINIKKKAYTPEIAASIQERISDAMERKNLQKSAMLNAKPISIEEFEILLDEYIPQDFRSLEFAFNDKTRYEFLKRIVEVNKTNPNTQPIYVKRK